MNNYLLTAESVTPGHPDKLSDIIADAVLDAVLADDKYGRVACEVMVGNGYVVVGGEITTKTWIDINNLVRGVIKDIGYTKPEYGFDYRTVAVFNTIHEQSSDIARGVRKTATKKQGAGDQGISVGYACSETKELMPLPIMLAHKLVRRLTEVRKNESLPWLRPDGKAQVSIEYRNGQPYRLHSVVIAAQHDPNIKMAQLKSGIISKVIKPVCRNYITRNTKFYINNTGRFVIGGPCSDTGMTGRKNVVDAYGANIPIGGGSFSGKDPTKVDRSGAYMARYIAKNIVAAGLAEKCEVQLAYVIGGIEPLSLNVNFFGTGKVEEERIVKAIPQVFKLAPGEIIQELNLLRPIYRKTAMYGHFGREEKEFSWERRDRVKRLLHTLSS